MEPGQVIEYGAPIKVKAYQNHKGFVFVEDSKGNTIELNYAEAQKLISNLQLAGWWLRG